MIDSKIETFLHLAKIRNFTKTAQLLNLTQPAVSQHIKYLEEIYGVKLFEKKGRDLLITDEGKIFLEYAKKVNQISKCAYKSMQNITSLKKTYKVGATRTIGDYVLPDILSSYTKINKDIKLNLVVENTEYIIKNILKENIDFALVEGLFNRNKFESKLIKKDELGIVMHKDCSLNKLHKISMEDVLSGDLILREEGSGTRDVFEREIIKSGYKRENIKSIMEIGSINAIKKLIKKNIGYSIMSYEAIKDELESENLIFRRIDGISIFREFNFIYKKEVYEEFYEEFYDFMFKNLSKQQKKIAN